MTALPILALLQLSIPVTGTESYAAAHRLTATTGRPMVVMVSAEWCPACRKMEREVIPSVREHGVLRRVAFAVVDVDRQRELGRKLTRGGPIPQLLMFRRTTDGWRLSRLVGGQDSRTVEEFIDRGLNRDEAAKQTRPSVPRSAKQGES